ncbi:hypothetical protein [Photobacterium galatheae]|uniref:JmjC domain-containing protein n=1 Tax=Photobacterium galatheae TaxID=1654360 RepID=A0A066RLA1_9GAMM|nr:hypothetical protein [Photobacterium galatheae]KDM91124.1 hypothetical protein EA58_13315 [Photobacterium galatheae]MCM0150154.1 hypothetical protein [Photobacterium galatheae]
MNIRENAIQELMAFSQELKKFCVIQNAITNHEDVFFQLKQVFTTFSESNIPRARVWIDGGQRYTAADDLVSKSISQIANLELFLKETLSSEKFCITLNGLSSYSEVLSSAIVAHILHPIFAQAGKTPNCGTDVYSFIGNYGFTPFGVHDDQDHSLLFHVGPEPKIAYIWEREQYESITGGTLASTDYEALLSHANVITLYPGDLLFIPKGDFHIFETKGFSVTLGVTIYPDDLLLESTQGLRLMAGQLTDQDQIMNTALTLNELVQLRRLAVLSNGSIIYPPMMKRADDRLTLALNPSISAKTIYPVYAMKIGDREALIVRMRVIWSKSTGLMSQISERINAANSQPLREFLVPFEGDNLKKIVVSLLNRVHQMGGISVE